MNQFRKHIGIGSRLGASTLVVAKLYRSKTVPLAHRAVLESRYDVLKTIDSRTLEAQDAYGLTSLHIAVLLNDQTAVNLLGRQSRLRHIESTKYATPLDFARLLGYEHLFPEIPTPSVLVIKDGNISRVSGTGIIPELGYKLSNGVRFTLHQLINIIVRRPFNETSGALCIVPFRDAYRLYAAQSVPSFYVRPCTTTDLGTPVRLGRHSREIAAAREIQCGEVISEYGANYIHPDDVKTRLRIDPKTSSDLELRCAADHANPDIAWVPITHGNGADMANHSTPNAILTSIVDGGTSRPIIVATRHIASHESITVDYGYQRINPKPLAPMTIDLGLRHLKFQELNPIDLTYATLRYLGKISEPAPLATELLKYGAPFKHSVYIFEVAKYARFDLATGTRSRQSILEEAIRLFAAHLSKAPEKKGTKQLVLPTFVDQNKCLKICQFLFEDGKDLLRLIDPPLRKMELSIAPYPKTSEVMNLQFRQDQTAYLRHLQNLVRNSRNRPKHRVIRYHSASQSPPLSLVYVIISLVLIQWLCQFWIDRPDYGA